MMSINHAMLVPRTLGLLRHSKTNLGSPQKLTLGKIISGSLVKYVPSISLGGFAYATSAERKPELDAMKQYHAGMHIPADALVA